MAPYLTPVLVLSIPFPKDKPRQIFLQKSQTWPTLWTISWPLLYGCSSFVIIQKLISTPWSWLFRFSISYSRIQAWFYDKVPWWMKNFVIPQLISTLTDFYFSSNFPNWKSTLVFLRHVTTISLITFGPSYRQNIGINSIINSLVLATKLFCSKIGTFQPTKS